MNTISNKKEKKTNDEILSNIQIKSIEKESLDKAFEILTSLGMFYIINNTIRTGRIF